MEEDYLSKRNIYKIDDSDAGLVLDGYSEFSVTCNSRMCRTGTSVCFREYCSPLQISYRWSALL